VVISKQLFSCRADVTIIAGIVFELITRELGIFLTIVSLMWYTGRDITFFEVLVIFAVTVCLIRNGYINLDTGIGLMCFNRLGKNLCIMCVGRRRDCCGDNTTLVVNDSVALVTKRTFAILFSKAGIGVGFTERLPKLKRIIAVAVIIAMFGWRFRL
jgi:high-affinity K+ transport system ATPase subunit B